VPLHFPCETWILRAVVRVKVAGQMGHSALETAPDFSRWCRLKLLKFENTLPLQEWSQHCNRVFELIIRNCSTFFREANIGSNELCPLLRLNKEGRTRMEDWWQNLQTSVSMNREPCYQGSTYRSC
jgi:hypothetical protein